MALVSVARMAVLKQEREQLVHRYIVSDGEISQESGRDCIRISSLFQAARQPYSMADVCIKEPVRVSKSKIFLTTESKWMSLTKLGVLIGDLRGHLRAPIRYSYQILIEPAEKKCLQVSHT